MTQTSKIAGTFIIAWIVFITTRGELPAYLSLLGIGGSGGVSSPSGCAAAASTTPPASGSSGGTSRTTVTLPGINIPPGNSSTA